MEFRLKFDHYDDIEHISNIYFSFLLMIHSEYTCKQNQVSFGRRLQQQKTEWYSKIMILIQVDINKQVKF